MLKTRRAALYLGAFVLAALTIWDVARARAQPASVPARGPVNLTVQMDVQEKSTKVRRPVTPGELLHSGDKIVLRVEVDRKAYLRVLQVSPSQKVAVIFPPSGTKEAEVLIEPGVQKVIPGPEDALELDEELGSESFVIIATPEPLSTVDPALAQKIQAATSPPLPVAPPAPIKVQDTTAPPPPPPPPPPPRPPFPVTTDERRWVIPIPGKPHVLRVKALYNGVALARFGYKHAPAAASKAPPK